MTATNKIIKLLIIVTIFFSLSGYIFTMSFNFLFSVLFGGLLIILDFFLLKNNMLKILDVKKIKKSRMFFLGFGFIMRIIIIAVMIIIALKYFKLNILGLLIGISVLPISITIFYFLVKKN